MSQDVIKIKQGMSYSCKEKKIILNVFKYFRKLYPNRGVTKIAKITSRATGCSDKSIFRFKKEEDSPEGFKEPSKKKVRKKISINSRFVKYDESVREGIKSVINDLKSKSMYPILSIILKNVNSKDTLPNFSAMTLRRLLFDMGFRYEKEKTTNKSILVQKKEYSPRGSKDPSKQKDKNNMNINNRFIKYDESVRESIKSVINDLKSKNIMPTLTTILNNVNSNDTLPNFSAMTLRRLLFDMGFRYEKVKGTRKSILVQKHDVKTKNSKQTDKNTEPNISKVTPCINRPQKETTGIENIQPLRPISEAVPQNETYASNQNEIHYLGYQDNRIIEEMSSGMPIGFQQTTVLGHRMSHSVHPIPHNAGFLDR